MDDQDGRVVDAEEEVDPRMALMGEPIIGMDRMVYDDATGSGAIPARPLSSPKAMSAAQRAIHDLTHLPYDPGCEICASTRRPNTHHQSVKSSERDVPLLVGDYCFPKHSDDSEPIICLVIKVYPYKPFFVCVVPHKGRDLRVVQRLVRFIRECGLVHFTYRSDREPAILAMLDEACAILGRVGERADADTVVSHDELVTTGGALNLDPNVDDDEPYVKSSEAHSSHTAAPELTHPGESQSNGLAERAVGVWEDQFRTLKHALELRLKHRLPASHPITSWLVEHTAWILNKYHLDSDGRTAYGRLHGREGRE